MEEFPNGGNEVSRRRGGLRGNAKAAFCYRLSKLLHAGALKTITAFQVAVTFSVSSD